MQESILTLNAGQNILQNAAGNSCRTKYPAECCRKFLQEILKINYSDAGIDSYTLCRKKYPAERCRKFAGNFFTGNLKNQLFR